MARSSTATATPSASPAPAAPPAKTPGQQWSDDLRAGFSGIRQVASAIKRLHDLPGPPADVTTDALLDLFAEVSGGADPNPNRTRAECDTIQREFEQAGRLAWTSLSGIFASLTRAILHRIAAGQQAGDGRVLLRREDFPFVGELSGYTTCQPHQLPPSHPARALCTPDRLLHLESGQPGVLILGPSGHAWYDVRQSLAYTRDYIETERQRHEDHRKRQALLDEISAERFASTPEARQAKLEQEVFDLRRKVSELEAQQSRELMEATA